MNGFAKFLASASLLMVAGAFAVDETPPQGNPAFTQQELDQMLAPVALYPDSLLSQVLMAATYPLEIVEAAHWSHANPNLTGAAAVQAVADRDWDPSVKSLVAFPQILQTMDDRIEWTERLGDAFLGQQAQVMDTIQALRHRAQANGYLKSNERLDVEQDGDYIEIAPTNPEIVYVPVYDPTIVYGPWWWPAYPPVYWGPWYGYYWYGGFAWGVGIGIGIDFFYGGWDWHHHHAYVHDHHGGHDGGPPHEGGRPPHDGNRPPHDGNRPPDGSQPWQHDTDHRRGVPYRNDVINRQFGRTALPDTDQFRGHPQPAPAPSTSASRLGFPAQQSQRSYTPQTYGPSRTTPPGGGTTQPFGSARPPAFEGIGRGPEVRGYSARGAASMPKAMPRAAAPRAPAAPRPAPARPPSSPRH